ncbi:MAG: pantoate--beta-alanine ligase [Solirubrobacteraceae bacterium]|jgi:pantoate--beta-alanine ligase|nr:pantoate--beta-alanine ligase [Solirubrobacteraceae bacterium]
MRTVRTVAELRHELMPHHGSLSVGLVPTMGAFHEGHLSLIRAARERCDLVVVSLFVNPAQFDEAADLSAYPRDEARDAALAQEAGGHVLFAPPVEEVYPDGFATTVHVAGLTDTLEGAHRPGHFDGVATVVTKLLNAVRPHVAFFGGKDAQQVAVIRRVVADLDLGVEIDVRPTVRDADGLALSSRNARLAPADRERALTLVRALRNVAVVADVGGTVEDALALGRRAMTEQGVEPEYLVAVDPHTLRPVQSFEEGEVLVAVAARVGEVRLIDNLTVSAPARGHGETKRGIPCNA